MKLRPYQQEFKTGVEAALSNGKVSTLAVMPTGCHAAGQKLLMYDGSETLIEDIKVGDQLMGPDGPRNVLQLCRGRSRMVRVFPVKGKSWAVNEDHILTLVKTKQRNTQTPCHQGGLVIDVPVSGWERWAKWKKHVHKLFRVPVRKFGNSQFNLALDPYFIGILLGDGTVNNKRVAVTTADNEIVELVHEKANQLNMRVAEEAAGGKSKTYHIREKSQRGRAGNRMVSAVREAGIAGMTCATKQIPHGYKTSTWENRLELLAGLIDSDGSMSCNGYDFISKSPALSDGVSFVSRSLGLAAYVTPCKKSSQFGTEGDYYRVSISGDTDIIPCRIPHKKAAPRKQKKDVLRTGFHIEEEGDGDYYGFTLDGDGRYLLDDFTVTHNTGKTVCFSHVAHDWKSGRVLILAHREELIFQAANKISIVTGDNPEIEMGEYRAQRHGLLSASNVIVSSIQTQNAGPKCQCDSGGCDNCIGGIVRRMQRFDPNDFGLVIIDEAHHSTAATYQRVIDYYRQNPRVRILGVTATPDRTDETALGKVYDSVAFEYGVLDAISDGWLVPIKQEWIICENLDFSLVRTTAGDLNSGELEKILIDEESLHQVTTPTIEISGDKATLVFAASVAHAELMSEIFNRHKPNSSICIHGKTPKEDRRNLLDRYSKGEFQYLCGCGVFLEGFDEPRIEVVAMARPTKSRSLYAQAIGRGTRPIDPPMQETAEDRLSAIATSSKPELLVLDFVGNSGRHKLISTADILGGNYEDDVVELAISNAKEKGGKADMLEELQAAQEESDTERIRKRKEVKAKATYTRKEINAFDLFDLAPAREPGWHKGRRPSEKMAAMLEKNGVDKVHEMSFTQAKQVIGHIIERRNNKLCSYKQARLLDKYGESTNLGFTEASAKIDAIAKNGWKPLR